MAWAISVENIQSAGEGWWYLKQKLVAGGATVKLSSDGTTNGAGDNLNPGDTYYDGAIMETLDCWMVIQFPSADGVVREWCIQLDGTDNGYADVYVSSDGSGFSGGGPTTRPTAADEEAVNTGGGPLFNADSVYDSPTSSARFDDAPLEVSYYVGDSDEKYSFCVEGRWHDVPGPTTLIFMDVTKSPDAADADPAVYGVIHDAVSVCDSSSDTIWSTDTAASSGNIMAGWYKKGTGDEAWVAYPLNHLAGNSGSVGGIDNYGTSQLYAGEADKTWPVFPLLYCRGDEESWGEAGRFGTKGISRIFRATMINLAPRRPVASADGTMKCVAGLVFPWDASLPALGA